MALILSITCTSSLQIEWAVAPGLWYNEDKMVQSLVPGIPFTVDELYRKSLLFCIDCDIILNYPRAILPNEITLGSLTIKKPKTLPADLEKVFSEAEQGVVVMSFGSTFPDTRDELFLEVFRRIPYTVIWRHFGEKPKDVPDNVKIMRWLPQHDLLAQEKTKLFITHCGNSGYLVFFSSEIYFYQVL